VKFFTSGFSGNLFTSWNLLRFRGKPLKTPTKTGLESAVNARQAGG
jgi:hypothetical protein